MPAQETRGEILGRVTDPSGAVVSGASVRAIDHASNAAAAAIANASGDYRLPSLNPGLYEVSVEMPGFRRYRRARVAVRSGESASVDVKLEVGPASERIKVVAQAPLVGTASFEMAVKSEKFLELPIRDGTPVMLAVLAPGVVNVSDGGTYRPYDNQNSSSPLDAFKGLRDQLVEPVQPTVQQYGSFPMGLPEKPENVPSVPGFSYGRS